MKHSASLLNNCIFVSTITLVLMRNEGSHHCILNWWILKNNPNQDEHLNVGVYCITNRNAWYKWFDTTYLFKIWTLDRDGPHADFRMNKNEFFVVDYDGDGAMPYILNKDSLTIFYNDFIQKGLIVSISKETLIICWDHTGKPTKYIEWKK